MDQFTNVTLELLKGFGQNCTIFGLTLLMAIPLGLIISMGSMSKILPLKAVIKTFVWIIRGTPLMLQLFVVYYGPYYVFRIPISANYRIYAAIIGFALNYAAYFAEIYRSGIESMPVGQYEAARLLGYSKASTFFKIILPQVIKRILPSVTNEIITLVKDTSLSFAIAYAEMFTMAKQVAAQQSNIMPLFVAGLFYYIFNIVVAWVMGRVEKKLSYFE
jgi:polar amino acid transport system permease protein/polar amino acid transport system substrate-binding protein